MNPLLPNNTDGCNHDNLIQKAFDDVFNECCVNSGTEEEAMEELCSDEEKEEEEEMPLMTTCLPHLVDAVLVSAIDEILKRDCTNSAEGLTCDPGPDAISCVRNDNTIQTEVNAVAENKEKKSSKPTKKIHQRTTSKKIKDNTPGLFAVKKVHVLQKPIKPSSAQKFFKVRKRKPASKASAQTSLDDLDVSRVGFFSGGSRARKVIGSDRVLRTLQSTEVTNYRYHAGGVWEDIVCKKT
ncbi:hypothetical protein CAPTEDRAFT_186611 [Capitella teleta]|uniref:Uncharacterized protein n=1 Tax=Capitella teleta TaxID=283909 RepID=R7TG71_CAPTE|nr:hypothetical protein CAPTEDRAFT_186611 [Capitella teleta]|eukprot:ELT90551.1 hypothetical protein CAPTEDRAFT_186611 [Capitella teleta]